MNADDILYAPIEKAPEIDFYYRMRENGWCDWYPVSQRSHDWMKHDTPSSYHNRVYGWAIDFSFGSPSLDANMSPSWIRELINDNYAFEQRQTTEFEHP